jgi:hypothetical protein
MTAFTHDTAPTQYADITDVCRALLEPDVSRPEGF